MNAKLRSLLGETFQVSTERINQKTSPKTLQEWDSFATVNLVAALENAFQCTFSMEEMVRLTSVRDIEQLLRDKGFIE